WPPLVGSNSVPTPSRVICSLPLAAGWAGETPPWRKLGGKGNWFQRRLSRRRTERTVETLPPRLQMPFPDRIHAQSLHLARHGRCSLSHSTFYIPPNS